MTATADSTWTPARTVRGPRFGLPHLLLLRRNPIGHAEWLRERYGDVLRMRVFGVTMFVTAGPALAEEVLVNRERVYANGPAWSHLIGPFFRRAGIVGWSEVDDPRMHRLLKELTLDLALETFVGVDLSDAERRRINTAFIHAVRAGASIVRRPVPGTPWARGLAAREVLEEFFRTHLPAKRRDGGDDLFAQLCVARSEDDHDDLDGLPPGPAPAVAGRLPCGVGRRR